MLAGSEWIIIYQATCKRWQSLRIILKMLRQDHSSTKIIALHKEMNKIFMSINLVALNYMLKAMFHHFPIQLIYMDY